MEKQPARSGEPAQLGSYEIVRKLARGGMAELFLARAAAPLEKLVVVKRILPKYASSAKFVQLFLDEARLAASLNHAHIVQVYDIGHAGGDHFFTMEFLHGQDLRSILHRAWREGQRVPIHHAIQVAACIASALHYAHEKRRPDGSLLDIVHRDVSPSNVIVSYDGAVKLVDFGVAKAATSTHKTRTGTLKGKIAYMSPEQAKGAPIDRRSDLFSLGIVLWEMVTTQRLFRGENDLATLQLIIHQAPKRPTEVVPDCPPELERIVLKALSQDVNTRYATAEEMQRDLEALVETLGLSQSSSALATYVSNLFGDEVASWERAQAAGIALGEHLTSIHGNDLTTPVSESDFVQLESLLDDDLEELDDEDEQTEHMEKSALAPPEPALAPVVGVIDSGSGRVERREPARPPPLRPGVRRDPTGSG
ncbi:MAG: serine/threonine protein kinase, partial [Deltaproteobacteria bacterium]|nr:serine/threonine protein kinase [Deltaproteobacteria bacterium]